MHIEPVKKDRVSEQVVDQLFKLIINGHLKPGDKLPAERELIKFFDVSRNSLREGIRVLEMLGFLVPRRGDGTYIAEMSSDLFEGYLTSVRNGNRNILAADILETRLVVEPAIARYAAQRRNKQQLKMLEAVLGEMEEGVSREQLSVSHDLVFHVTLAKASQNKALEEVLTSLMGYTSDLLMRSYEINKTLLPLRTQQMLDEHRKVYLAIEKQNPEAAEQAMYEHLSNVRDKIQHISEENLNS